MILADTSVWIDHFRKGEPKLTAHLDAADILMHPWISGELGCGNLQERKLVLSYLSALPKAKMARDEDVWRLIEERKLWGRGLGWMDMHLLASALLSECEFWTRDKRLAEAARDLGVTYDPAFL